MSKTLPLVFGASTHNQLNQKKETKQIYRVQINMLCVSGVSGEGFIFFLKTSKVRQLQMCYRSKIRPRMVSCLLRPQFLPIKM
jgi:hypothetical protein